MGDSRSNFTVIRVYDDEQFTLRSGNLIKEFYTDWATDYPEIWEKLKLQNPTVKKEDIGINIIY